MLFYSGVKALAAPPVLLVSSTLQARVYSTGRLLMHKNILIMMLPAHPS